MGVRHTPSQFEAMPFKDPEARRAYDGYLTALRVPAITALRHRAITPRLYTLLSVPYGARLMQMETLVESRSEPAWARLTPCLGSKTPARARQP